MIRTRLTLLLAAIALFAALPSAQEFRFYPENIAYDSTIPTLEKVAGHAWGADITSYSEMERYLKALVAATPRAHLEKSGETWEGRNLYFLVLASEKNMGRLDALRAGMRKLADPRLTSEAEARSLITDLPAITWLAYGVHGNETSGPDAALLAAYHLLAARNDAMSRKILEESVVIIDPLQNPDGRDRFVDYYRRTRGRFPDPDPLAAEHNEDWPGGRYNHYLFDMNRDWFALTQPETRARVKAFLDWHPQVYADLHEMGSEGSFYFPPQAQPKNPFIADSVMELIEIYGRNNSRWFDRMQFDYFNREVYDSFYPGYGASWPMFHGTVGMTYEQASVRGLVRSRRDDTTMHYRDSIQRHFIASLSTAETTANNREKLLRSYYEFHRAALREGEQNAVKEYIIPPGNDPGRAAKLVSVLMAQGIEVKRSATSFKNTKLRNYYGGEVEWREFPAGTYIIPSAQPASRLVGTLLTKKTPMSEMFIQEQERRHEKRLSEQFYDITAWSLPLLYDVEAYMAEEASAVTAGALKQPPAKSGAMHGTKAALAYLIPWGTNSAARALADLERQGIRVYSSGQRFVMGANEFPKGTLVIKSKDNPKDLFERLKAIVADAGVACYPTDTSWVEQGINFGSVQMAYLKKARIAMAYNTPVNPSSAGWTRYLLEQVYGCPVTVIHTQQLRGADLGRFNVLIMPNVLGTSYTSVLGDAGTNQIKQWLASGGTLITFADATRWLTEEKIGLLSTAREYKQARPAARSAGESSAQTEREWPAAIPGAILRVELDTEHWLAFGYDGGTNVLVESSNIFAPLKAGSGRNVGAYSPVTRLLLSGFAWDDEVNQIANKPFLMYQPFGSGHVVAFTEDPNNRAFCDGLNLLFLNAVFFGPGH